MSFDRRDFLKLMGVAGLSVAGPISFAKQARAQESILYDGNFFVMVNAAGGWDPTSLCDPKGMLTEDEDNPMNQSFMQADIEEAGNIRYAPVGNHAQFFQKWSDRLMVINGVDTQTNGHDQGSRHVWSGKLSEGHPAFSALVASAKARLAPLAFLSNGGYDLTQGLVAPTRSGNTGTLQRVAFPFRADPNNENSRYHTQETEERIVAMQRARLEAMEAKARLPRVKESVNKLYTARIGENEVRRLTEFLPETLDNSGNPLRRQAQLALASYKAGLSVSVNLSTGGFDTHGNHDANHIPRLGNILDGVDFLMEEAERLDVADRVVVMVGSDFGRTPRYNGGNGKDHWPVTSVMMMGPGIPGNKVIGETTHEHYALPVNPDTLEIDENGINITPEHIHRALRKHAGIEESEVARQFPLNGVGDLPLFG